MAHIRGIEDNKTSFKADDFVYGSPYADNHGSPQNEKGSMNWQDKIAGIFQYINPKERIGDPRKLMAHDANKSVDSLGHGVTADRLLNISDAILSFPVKNGTVKIPDRLDDLVNQFIGIAVESNSINEISDRIDLVTSNKDSEMLPEDRIRELHSIVGLYRLILNSRNINEIPALSMALIRNGVIKISRINNVDSNLKALLKTQLEDLLILNLENALDVAVLDDMPTVLPVDYEPAQDPLCEIITNMFKATENIDDNVLVNSLISIANKRLEILLTPPNNTVENRNRFGRFIFQLYNSSNEYLFSDLLALNHDLVSSKNFDSIRFKVKKLKDGLLAPDILSRTGIFKEEIVKK